jgi:hypothetical protein
MPASWTLTNIFRNPTNNMRFILELFLAMAACTLQKEYDIKKMVKLPLCKNT